MFGRLKGLFSGPQVPGPSGGSPAPAPAPRQVRAWKQYQCGLQVPSMFSAAFFWCQLQQLQPRLGSNTHSNDAFSLYHSDVSFHFHLLRSPSHLGNYSCQMLGSVARDLNACYPGGVFLSSSHLMSISCSSKVQPKWKCLANGHALIPAASDCEKCWFVM